ncbi:hypothetical protein C922_05236 [Plasmodium inui San Antonio 1]|uniref:Uncharacterized protein n=1 Tax=Plasmodium inui San Antonio 1 TaxID=1237626 RepID=W7AGE6_9APIC|nr:hypothetical protein C922_05236 [Plasmodium inui San Antonio 1]EUD64386.1 hypothetical protein C922_05236 [Plasmodium inui San Antonio 1]
MKFRIKSGHMVITLQIHHHLVTKDMKKYLPLVTETVVHCYLSKNQVKNRNLLAKRKQIVKQHQE